MSQVRPKGEKVGRHRKEFQVDGLREKLREFFRQEVRAELRAVAALNNVELITALISFNWQLALVGLQLRILNGVVSLLTTRVENKALAAYVSEQNGASGNLQMTTASLEVLACIAFRQPISQAEIDLLFDADKRGLVVKLRDLKLVEEFAGADGRLRFATTENLSEGRCHRASRAPESATETELVFDRDLRGTVSQDSEHRGSELCWRPRVGPADSAPGRKVSGDQHPVDRTTEKRSGPAKHRTPY